MIKTTHGTIRWRLDRLEKDVESLDKKLDKIMTNDLPHLNEQVSSLNTSIKIYATFNVGVLILGLLISKFLI